MAAEGRTRTVLELVTKSDQFFPVLDEAERRVRGLKKPFDEVSQELGRQDKAWEALRKRVSDANDVVGKTAERLKQLSGDLKSAGQRMSDAGTALTKGLTAPLVAIGALSAKAAIDFESSFAGIRKTVDASEAQFAQLAQGMRNLSKEIPVNVNELNKIGEAAGQLGIKTENIL